MHPQHTTVLIADDDPDDRDLIREAFGEAQLTHDLRFVKNGLELMEYLRCENRTQNRQDSPWPSVLLLDLNMPKMDGWQVLDAIQKDASLRLLRVVVLTTSKAEEDVLRSYRLCATSFITKPVSFMALVDVIRTISKYWLETVELPHHDATPQPTHA